MRFLINRKILLILIFSFIFIRPAFADYTISIPSGYQEATILNYGTHYYQNYGQICKNPDSNNFSLPTGLLCATAYPTTCQEFSGTIYEQTIIHSTKDILICDTSDVIFAADSNLGQTTIPEQKNIESIQYMATTTIIDGTTSVINGEYTVSFFLFIYVFILVITIFILLFLFKYFKGKK